MKIRFILLIINILCLLSCSKKNKVIYIYRYDYQNGIINSNRILYGKDIYNEQGKIVLRVKYSDIDTNINEKRIYRYDNNNNNVEYVEYDNEGLLSKEISVYGDNGKPTIIKRFKRYDKEIKLYSEVFFYYDKDNKLVKKRWYGSIDFFGNQQPKVIRIENNMVINDTATAIIIRNNRGKRDSIHIYEYQKEGYDENFEKRHIDTIAYRFSYVYSYNINDSLVMISKNNGNKYFSNDTVKYYKYNNGRLSEVSDFKSRNNKIVTLYDENNKESSEVTYNGRKIVEKVSNFYKDDIKTEQIFYDEFNEPIVKYVYELQ